MKFKIQVLVGMSEYSELNMELNMESNTESVLFMRLMVASPFLR